MSMTTDQARWFAETTSAIIGNIARAILGKDHAIRLAITAMLAEGHLLLEDYPGTGKTSLARAMAQTVQGTSSRIQFTPDLLPSDVTGVTIYDQRSGEFEFHPGPIFASIVLADEINRASPKTQSALLEVMEESKITVDGKTYDVGCPFMVIATQNPIEQAGTYRLPEAQLDRFLMKTSLGYPDHDHTVEILTGNVRQRSAVSLGPVITTQAVGEMAELAGSVHIAPSVLDYITRLAEATRTAADVRLGVSIRGALALVRCSRVWAAGRGRHYVIPDDVKELAQPCLAHRLILDPESEFNGVTAETVLERVLQTVAPPTERASA
ncbi:MAG: AAA family ATPase [Propionibacteriaceae bacterium]